MYNRAVVLTLYEHVNFDWIQLNFKMLVISNIYLQHTENNGISKKKLNAKKMAKNKMTL